MADAGSGTRHRVVIVGGGFGGLLCAQGLKNAPVDVTLIDRRNFHLFQPLLYQVATGGLSPANIAAPLRSVLKYQKNTRCLLGEVSDFDLAGKTVLFADGGKVPFDTLVLATGSTHHYFGKDAQWGPIAPGLKTLEDATEIRRKVLGAFEKAEREPDPACRARLLTFVVIGGGPTGVEMAGAISELARQTLKRDFRAIHLKRGPNRASRRAATGTADVSRVAFQERRRGVGEDGRGVVVRLPRDGGRGGSRAGDAGQGSRAETN